MSDPQRPHGLQPTRLLHPWDFPGTSTGVGCHCLLWIFCLGYYKSLFTLTLFPSCPSVVSSSMSSPSDPSEKLSQIMSLLCLKPSKGFWLTQNEVQMACYGLLVAVQSCLTPSDTMDCSLPGPSVHGIFQARVLEWGAIAFSGNVTREGNKYSPR